MEQIELEAQRRQISGKKVKKLRSQGLIPAILYGHRTEPIPLQVEERPLRRVLERAGAHHLITLKVDIEESRTTLAREIQIDPITRSLLHVDFYEVLMTEKITTEVPIVLVGRSPLVERKEAILVQSLEAVEVECLPSELIEAIEVNLEKLVEIDQAILVKDLQAEVDIDILTDGQEMVVRLLPLEAPEVVEEKVEEAPAEVEVVSRAKRKEEVVPPTKAPPEEASEE